MKKLTDEEKALRKQKSDRKAYAKRRRQELERAREGGWKDWKTMIAAIYDGDAVAVKINGAGA